MSLPFAVGAGTLVGAVAALGIYSAIGPDDLGHASAPAAPTFAPVPTPTVTQLADCIAPAVLKKGVCVTTEPGPRITSAPPAPSAPTTVQRTTRAPAATTEPAEEHDDDGDHEDEHDGEHEDDGDDD